MAATPVAPPVEESLAWEAEQRPRAGLASIAAGVLLLVTFVYTYVGFNDSPSVTLTDGLRDVLGRPLPEGRKGLLTESAMWFDDNALELLVVTALAALGTVLLAFVLGYLFRAIQARRPETARIILYLALVGPILYGIGPLVSVVTAVASAGGYVSDARFSTLGAHDALRTGSGIAVGQGFVGIGRLATAAAIVLISLNAMRVGLFTRFVGILGCIVGALLILPVFGPPGIVQSFWLVALGLLILGRGRAVPPAWASGRAEPWPSQQALRERKEREARGGGSEPVRAGGSVVVADQEEDDASTSDAPHSASKKRKRKRR